MRVALRLGRKLPRGLDLELEAAVVELGHTLVPTLDRVDCLITDRAEVASSVPLVLRLDAAAPRAEIVARAEHIRGILGRLARTPEASVDVDLVPLGEVRVHLDKGIALRGEESTKLTPIEVAVLRRLVAARGAFVSRQVLEREVWGYAEGARTRTVLSTMHRLRSKLELDTSEPRYLQSDRQRGYRLVASSANAPESTRAPLFGREVLMKHLLGRAALSGVTTLTGVGGVGKTRLAREIVHATWPTRDVVWCECAEVTDRPGLVRALARALDCSVDPARPELSLMLAFEGRRQPLLVLDDLDRAVPAARALLSDIAGEMAARFGAHVLVTSREGLGLANESVVVVPQLEQDAALAMLAHGLGLEAGVEVLALAEVARACERLPLALELSALLGRYVPLTELAQGLGARLRTLTLREGRHANLERTLDLSWQLLTSPAQRLLARLAALPGGFSFETVEALAEPPSAAFAILNELMAKSLVTSETGSDSSARLRLLADRTPRFAMLSSIREHALAQLPLERGATVRWLVAVAERLGERSDGDLASFGLALTGYRNEAANLEAAARWVIANEPTLAPRLFSAMWGLWLAVGPLSHGLELVDAARDAHPDPVLDLLRGRLLVYMGRYVEALEALRDAVKGVLTKDQRALVLDLIAGLASGDEAASARREADLLLGDDAMGAAERHESRAAAAWADGDIEMARRETEAAAALFMRLGRGKRLLVQRINRGSHMRDLGEHAEAMRVLLRVHSDAESIRFGMAELYALYNLAHVHADRGDLAEARATFSRVAQRGYRHGSLGLAARAEVWRALLAEPAAMAQEVGEALAVAETIGDHEAMAFARAALTRLGSSLKVDLTPFPPMLRTPLEVLAGLPETNPTLPSSLLRVARTIVARLG